jgi:isoleucyl-tRNA synthetase
LPIENEIEKAKELSGAGAIEAFGIDRFNEECRAIVLRYTGEWKKTVDRMGRWVDFNEGVPDDGFEIHGVGLVGL